MVLILQALGIEIIVDVVLRPPATIDSFFETDVVPRAEIFLRTDVVPRAQF